MSDIKRPSVEPRMLDKVKAVLIENKKILITIVVVGIVLGLVYYFTTRGQTEVDDGTGNGQIGCPICENADCSAENIRIGVLEQENELLNEYKLGAEQRILELETELDNTEDALKRKTREFIGSTTGLAIAIVFAGIGGFFLAKRSYSSESAPASTSASTSASGTG